MIELVIDNLAMGGRGIGRIDGKTVFVPYTMPGDRVVGRVVREKKRYCEAELVEIIDPAPDRIRPECPVFGECGGCQWQHLSYAAQLDWKQKLFSESLTRAIGVDDDVFQPIIASPQPWGYRCRAQIKCRMTDGGFVAGFYRAGSHYVVDIDSCPLLADEQNRFFQAIKPLFATYRYAHRVPQLDLSVDDQGQLALIIHFLDQDHSSLAELFAPVAEQLNCSIYVQQGRKERLIELFSADPQVINPVPEMPLCFPPGGFVQVNLDQNRKLVADVLKHVPADTRVLDLYCGIGNFSLPIARQAGSVVGVEGFKPAVLMARENAGRHGMKNAEFIVADAVDGLGRAWGDGFDLVLLDPPRSGAYDVARQLIELQPETIIYVSCDPMTFGRDLQLLLNSRYEPLLLNAYDMFPQTGHIEGLAILKRCDRAGKVC